MREASARAPRRARAASTARDRCRRARPTSAMNSRVAPTPIGTVCVQRHAECALAASAAVVRDDLRIEADVEVGIGQAADVGRARAQRRHDVHVDAERVQQAADLARRRRGSGSRAARAEQVARGAGGLAARAARRPGRRHAVGEQRAHELVEGFGRAPVLLLRVGGQFERHHRHRQVHAPREARPAGPGSAPPCRTRRPAAPPAGSARRPRRPRASPDRRCRRRGRAPGRSCR